MVPLIVLVIATLLARHAAQAGVTLRGTPAMPLLPRLALQLVFIVLVWWSGIHADRHRAEARP
jgi:hypothetical protein